MVNISIIIGHCEFDGPKQRDPSPFVRPRHQLLEHCLKKIKIAAQHYPHFEVLIGSDGYLKEAEYLINKYDNSMPQDFKYFAFPRTNKYGGGDMRNAMMTWAKGNLLWFFDSDDWPTPDSMKVIEERSKHYPGHPLIFCMKDRSGKVLWPDNVGISDVLMGLKPHLGYVGGPMFIPWNNPDKLGRWGKYNASDAEFIANTLGRTPPPVWFKDVIVNVRAGDDRDPWECSKLPDYDPVEIIKENGDRK